MRAGPHPHARSLAGASNPALPSGRSLGPQALYQCAGDPVPSFELPVPSFELPASSIPHPAFRIPHFYRLNVSPLTPALSNCFLTTVSPW